MKKLVGLVLVVLIALPMSAFAQEEVEAKISWSAWGRTIFAPVVTKTPGDKAVPRDLASWGWNGRIGFNLKGESEKVGFQVDMNADAGNIGTQDQQKIWAKPFDMLTVEVGPSVFYDTLRGNGAFGSWNWIRPNGIGGEDNIFARGNAGEGDAFGSIIHVGMEGMHAFAALDIVEGGDREVYTTSIMIKRGQYGVGYAIPGLGLARVQYIGKAYDKDTTAEELESYGVVNAAVRLDQAIENLSLDVGFFMPTDKDNTNGDKTKIAAYANYKAGKATLHLLGEAELDKADAEGSEGTGMKVGVGADYDLGNGLGLNADVRYHNKNAVATADVDSQMAFLVGVTKFIGNGVIGIGVQGTTHNFGAGVAGKEKADDLQIAIPIKLEYWF